MEQQAQNIHHDLIERCRIGDREAFYSIYKLYSKAMYNVGFRITGREDEAEDVLQEAFISAFRNLESYRGDASFGSWLKKIVVNKAINVIKRKKMEPLPEDDRWDVPEEDTESFHKNDEDSMTVDRVKKAIGQLPDGYRTVLSLYLLEGYDHEEIAGIMGISESTSKSQLNRAKGKLKALLTTTV